MATNDKIGVLADAAKYDASCSTSGSARENGPGGLGNGAVGGICHAWASDGRCVALLKVLLSNVCAYDCAYCVNRRSNDVRRAAFEPEELVRLIVDFYRRNYIEGAFLSSGVVGCPDATMERLIWVARTLRTRERFHGYLHLKIIPGASEPLVLEAARWADRVSVNIELPSAASLARIAPDKSAGAILGPMRTLASASGFEPLADGRGALQGSALPFGAPKHDAPQGGQAQLAAGTPHGQAINGGGTPLPGADAKSMLPAIPSRPGAPRAQSAMPAPSAASMPQAPSRASQPMRPAQPSQEEGRAASVWEARKSRRRDPGAPVIPAGQTTQMVIGASPESDAAILSLAERLYLAYDVRRVYYSAFIPTGSDPRLPVVGKPPLAREHRLYQADWLFRFYGFAASEILDEAHPFLDAGLDPKSSWALRNLQFFPVELAAAEYADILRVPGIGPKSAARLVKARRQSSLRIASLSRLGVVMRRAKWFITVNGKMACEELRGQGIRALADPELLRRALSDPEFRNAPERQPELPWEVAT